MIVGSMGKKLAIKGHPTRGNEVVELLKMMGGKGSESFHCSDLNRFYYISHECICWDYIGPDEINEYEIFTLEEFLDKYPFKVGDKVYIKVDPNANCLGSEKIYGVIESAMWVEKFGHVVYKLKDYSGIFYREELYPHEEEEVSMEDNKLSSKYYEETDMEKTMFMLGHTLVPNTVDDKLEYEIFDGYEFDKVENNKIVLKPIKPKYPTTYAECCEVLVGRKPNPNEISFDKMELCLVDLDNTQSIDFQNPYLSQLNSLFRLRMCRDAYWKIAGEEMGLGKPWEPDYKNPDVDLYVIINVHNNIEKAKYGYGFQNCVLSFPTEEMRDVFFKNFKDLIEQCKELL